MGESPGQLYEFDGFLLDVGKRRLMREGTHLNINSKALDLLVFLIENSHRVVEKDELLESVWPGQFVEEANLSVQISALRKALGEKPGDPRFLITIPGKGYKFIADLTRGDEFIIENRKIERVTVTEQIEGIERSDRHDLTGAGAGHRLVIFAVLGVLVIALFGIFGYRYVAEQSRPDIRSLAVLPFSGQAGDADLEYLGDGLAESVIHSLSALRDVRIMSRDSAFKYRGTEPDAKRTGCPGDPDRAYRDRR
jgi:DNA-binding winged helix-turn-helix (wHTH) protein